MEDRRSVDFLRLARLALRRQYYAHLKSIGASPSNASGIIAKVAELRPLPAAIEEAYRRVIELSRQCA